MRGIGSRTRALAALTGILMGLALGVALADGEILAATAGIALGVAALASTRLAPPGRERWALLVLLGIAFALRLAVAVLLHAGSIATGGDGFITGDDREYALLAWGYVQFLAGSPDPPYVPPYWNGEAYLFGTYVYFVSAVFALLGPQVLVVKVINAAFGAVLVALVYDIGRRVFDAGAGRLAATLVAVFPSLVLWSALNLKDALTLLIIASALWLVLRFQLRPRAWWLAAAFAVLWPMETLRRYIFMGLLFVIPAAVWMTPRLRLASRLRWGASAMAVSSVLLLTNQAGSAWLGPGTLVTFEFVRQAMAANARTGFVERPPVAVEEGDTFVVGGRVSSSATPAVVVVPAGARLVVERAPAATAGPVGRQQIVVQAGDIVVVGPAGTTPAPPEERRPLQAGDGGVQLYSKTSGGDGIALRTASYFPKGLVFALFAPFPWSVGRSLDWLTVPEMLLWYVILAAAVWTAWTGRARWRLLGPLVLFVGGTILIFALAQGNVGTLFRHRAMVIPFAIVLASPTLQALTFRVRSHTRLGGLAIRLSFRTSTR